MKIAVVTALFGNVGNLHTPRTLFDGVDYVAFVDRERDCQGWRQIISPDFSIETDQFRNRRNAKIYKIMPHLFLPDYDFWIWADPTHELVTPPQQVCEHYFTEADIGVFKHTHRSCAYQEADEIKRLGIDHPNVIERQVEFYRRVGFPEQYGLFELPTFIRKNTDRVRKLNLRWWEQICRFSSRDQVSFPFVLWSDQIDPIILPGLSNGGLHKNEIVPQVRQKGT